jgi:hypothetical protein
MRRRLACAVVCAAALVACSEPPTKDRDQAQGAIAAARAAGAATYASDELRAAEASLIEYDTAVLQRDFRLALSAAIDAREGAYAAARRAADEKANARGQAEQLVAAVAARIAAGEQRLSGTGGARLTAAAASRLRAAVKAATGAVQKARALVTAQDYRGVVTLLTPVEQALGRELAPAAAAPGRSGR